MLKKLLSVFLILFLIYNICWSINRDKVYKPFKDALGGGKTIVNEEGYCYGIATPKWPEFTGNLYITEDMKFGTDEYAQKDTADILIWPSYDGSLEIGISISEGTKHTGEEDDPIEEINFMIDEQMNLIDNSNPEIEKIYERHLDDIRNLFHLTYEKWGILKLEDEEG